MIMCHEIQNMEPFNDVFYRNCFFNSVFPVIRHYGRDILPYLMYDMTVYILYGEKDVLIKSDFTLLDGTELNIHKLNGTLTQQGIQMHLSERQNEIIPYLHENLGQDRPVILWIDAFYCPYRKDTYQKLHWPHTILAYGYDEDDSCVYIIDHACRENLTYQKRELKTRHLIESYDAYLSTFLSQEPEPFSCYIFSKREDFVKPADDKDAATLFRKQLLKNRFLMQQSLETLQFFSKSISLDMLVGDHHYIDRFVDGVNSIVLHKELEIYRFTKIFPHMQEWIQIQKLITNRWIVIRAKLLKTVFSKKKDHELRELLGYQMKCLLQEEYAAYRLLISNL